MNRLLDVEWETLNNTILEIYSSNGSREFRLNFLHNLRALVAYDAGEFSLIDEDLVLFDSVEENYIGRDSIDIANKYNQFKLTNGQQITDFIWRYPKSFIASNSTIHQRAEYAAEADFNQLFVKSIGMNYCATITLWKDGKLWGELSLYLSTEYDFSEKDLYILGQLKDHLANHLAYIHAKLQSTQLHNSQTNYLLSHHLTDREIQVVALMIDDYSQAYSADKLCISVNTLKKHVSNIYHKLNINSKSELKQLLMDLPLNK